MAPQLSWADSDSEFAKSLAKKGELGDVGKLWAVHQSASDKDELLIMKKSPDGTSKSYFISKGGAIRWVKVTHAATDTKGYNPKITNYVEHTIANTKSGVYSTIEHRQKETYPGGGGVDGDKVIEQYKQERDGKGKVGDSKTVTKLVRFGSVPGKSSTTEIDPETRTVKKSWIENGDAAFGADGNYVYHSEETRTRRSVNQLRKAVVANKIDRVFQAKTTR